MGAHSDNAPACSACNKSRIMMVAMVPGRDGKEWWLCPPCHAAGLTDMQGNPIVIEKPALARGSSKKIPIAKEPERSAAKQEAGSFDRHPNEPEPEFKYTGGIQYVPDDDNYW